MMAGRITIAAALFLFMCGEDDETVVEVAAPAEPSPVEVAEVPPPAAPAPAHDGTVVAVGPHYFEVIAHDDGSIDAYGLGEAPPPSRAQVTVRLTGDDGNTHPVILVWNPSQSRY